MASSGGKFDGELIDRNAFRIENNQAKINEDLFPTLDYSNGNLTKKSIWDYMGMGERPSGVRRFFSGGHEPIEDTEGFGLFLRRLYDSCKETH